MQVKLGWQWPPPVFSVDWKSHRNQLSYEIGPLHTLIAHALQYTPATTHYSNIPRRTGGEGKSDQAHRSGHGQTSGLYKSALMWHFNVATRKVASSNCTPETPRETDAWEILGNQRPSSDPWPSVHRGGRAQCEPMERNYTNKRSRPHALVCVVSLCGLSLPTRKRYEVLCLSQTHTHTLSCPQPLFGKGNNN